MKGLRVKKSVCWSIVGLVMYTIVLVSYYVAFIAPNYERYGFTFQLNAFKSIEVFMWLMLVLMHATFISRRSAFIFSVYVFVAILFFIPTIILVALCDQPRGPLYSILGMLLMIDLVSHVRISGGTFQRYRFSSWVLFAIALALVVPIILHFGVQFNFENVYLADVYSTRDKFSATSSLGFDYAYNWLVKAFFPVLMAYFIIRKNFFFAFAAFVIMLYLYLISGNKIVYISSFVVVFFVFAGRTYFDKVGYFIAALVLGLITIPFVDLAVGSHELKGVFVMRTLFLPSQLNFYYFDFFKDFHLYFAESNFFRWFVDYPFERPIGFVISETYFNAPEMNSNNGIIGDGFMNLGYAGVIINIFLVSLIFAFFNSLQLDPGYLGVFFVVVFLLLSVPMLSMFITSGLWLLFLLGMSIMKWTPRSPQIFTETR